MLSVDYQCLDTGAEFASPSDQDGPKMAVAFAACLLEMLDTLPEPVIPSHMHARCAQITSREGAFEVNMATAGIILSFLLPYLYVLLSCWMNCRAHLLTYDFFPPIVTYRLLTCVSGVDICHGVPTFYQPARSWRIRYSYK